MGYLTKLGITELREVNQIANFTLVEWSDNIDISDNSPEKYVPEYEPRFSVTELDEMYYWHGLSKGWHSMNYKDFLVERRKKMALVIRDGYRKLREKTE